MMVYFSKLLLAVISYFITSFLLVNSCLSSDVRTPSYAGSFYPSPKQLLEKTIESLISKAKKNRVKLPTETSLKALILPHAGYIYSGLTAAHGSLVIDGKTYNKVILLGPDHRAGFSNCVVSNASVWQTPLMSTRVHEDAAKLLLHSDLFQIHDAYDSNEHSLEVVLPFLQYMIKSFEFIPVIMGQCDISRVVSVLDPFLDSNTLIVASSDLSHYLSYDEAVIRDTDTIRYDIAP